MTLIHPGQVVILDSGTTTYLVAQHLPPELNATIITNSPPIATVLATYANIDVIVLGGHLNKELQVAVGAATIEALQMFRADLCLLGVAGLHPDMGITVYDLEEAHVKRAMLSRAAEVAALASSEKLGTAAPYVIGPISELTHLVTNSTVAQLVLAPYQAAGLTVIQ